MGVIASLALLRVHVLVVELPGRPALRLRAEAAVRARGWIVTRDPADADLLLVCGTPRAAIADAVDAIWWEVPAPRARRTVRATTDLQGALDSAARVLADGALQRRAAAGRGTAPDPPPPGRFGPVRPDWPAGLQLDCAVGGHGRITAVGTRRLPAEVEDDPVPPGTVAAADAARLLRIAGWATPALRLDRVVDLLLARVPLDRLRPRLRRVARLVRRSTVLRWRLAKDVPSVDVRERVLALLSAAAAGEDPPSAAARVLVGAALESVPLLVTATERILG